MNFLAALMASCLWGVADYTAGTLSRRIPALVVFFLSQLVALTTVGGVVLLTTLRGATLTNGPYLAWGALCGVVSVLAIVSFYRALAIGNMGSVASVAALGIVLPVLVGIASSPPTFQEAVGVTVAVCGTALTCRPTKIETNHIRSLILAGAASLGFGFLYIASAEGARYNILMTVFVQRVTAVALLVPILLADRPDCVVRRELPRPRLPLVGRLALIGTADVTAGAAYSWASRNGDLEIIAVLASLYPVVTILLARKLLMEPISKLQLAGILATVSGVALLTT